MAKQIINIGRTANDRSGDPLRTAFTKVNSNFTELYDLIGNSSGASVTTSATAPVNPVLGDLWYDTVSGRTYVYYDSSWIDSSPVNGVGILTTAAPEHSYGVVGNVAGMVAFDNSYIYYCTSNYVNTSTNIWKRVALDSTPW
jgi:hypothetical protein